MTTTGTGPAAGRVRATGTPAGAAASTASTTSTAARPRLLGSSTAHLHRLAHAAWPESPADTPGALPPIPGFVLSPFNPLVAAVAARCLTRTTTAPPRRTALLLASASGDRRTADALADAVRTGRRVQPLLFFQSNPNAILGHVAATHDLRGPIVCLGPAPDGTPGSLDDLAADEAALLLADGDADAVLVIRAELATEADGDDGIPTATATLLATAAPVPGKEDL